MSASGAPRGSVATHLADKGKGKGSGPQRPPEPKGKGSGSQQPTEPKGKDSGPRRPPEPKAGPKAQTGTSFGPKAPPPPPPPKVPQQPKFPPPAELLQAKFAAKPRPSSGVIPAAPPAPAKAISSQDLSNPNFAKFVGAYKTFVKYAGECNLALDWDEDTLQKLKMIEAEWDEGLFEEPMEVDSEGASVTQVPQMGNEGASSSHEVQATGQASSSGGDAQPMEEEKYNKGGLRSRFCRAMLRTALNILNMHRKAGGLPVSNAPLQTQLAWEGALKWAEQMKKMCDNKVHFEAVQYASMMEQHQSLLIEIAAHMAHNSPPPAVPLRNRQEEIAHEAMQYEWHRAHGSAFKLPPVPLPPYVVPSKYHPFHPDCVPGAKAKQAAFVVGEAGAKAGVFVPPRPPGVW